MKNTEEPWSPNADLMIEKSSSYWCCGAAKVRRSLSGQEQVDAAALLVQTRRLTAAAELGLFGVARKKKR